MNIEIDGLSPLQQELADRIWAMDSTEEMVAFFDSLPRSLLHDAYVVYQMIIWATWDQTDPGDMTEAQELIDRVRNLPC